MAKNDYHVIVYKILNYLYDSLKNGENIDVSLLSSEALDITESYLNYVFLNMIQSEYINGVNTIKAIGHTTKQVKLTPNIQITPLGIEYLSENSTMQKVMKFIKEYK